MLVIHGLNPRPALAYDLINRQERFNIGSFRKNMWIFNFSRLYLLTESEFHDCFGRYTPHNLYTRLYSPENVVVTCLTRFLVFDPVPSIRIPGVHLFLPFYCWLYTDFYYILYMWCWILWYRYIFSICDILWWRWFWRDGCKCLPWYTSHFDWLLTLLSKYSLVN
jgi:hypothetical protein